MSREANFKRAVTAAGLAVAAAGLAACGGGGGDSGVVIPPPPPPPAPFEDTFGAGFGTTFRIAANANPREPSDADLIPLSLTTNPVAVP